MDVLEALTEAAQSLPDHIVDRIKNPNQEGTIAETAAHYFVEGVRWAAREINSREAACSCRCMHAREFIARLLAGAGAGAEEETRKGKDGDHD